ncbi:hypothetical protein [Planomonospora algeriensis]
MTSIVINPDGTAEPVTVNVNCSGCSAGQPTPDPVPAARPLSEAALHGFGAATVLPHYCDRTVEYAGPVLVGVSAVLPAGTPVGAVGIAVAGRGEGEASQESRVGVYIGGVAELAGQSAHKATLFTAAGWRWAALEAPVAAAEVDRVVWLVAQVPHFPDTMPSFLAAAQGPGAQLVNSHRYRSVIVNGRQELPPIFDGDALPFVARAEVPAMAVSARPVYQP